MAEIVGAIIMILPICLIVWIVLAVGLVCACILAGEIDKQQNVK